jgi:hypothetical protein
MEQPIVPVLMLVLQGFRYIDRGATRSQLANYLMPRVGHHQEMQITQIVGVNSRNSQVDSYELG